MNFPIQALLSNYLYQLPGILIFLAGVVIAIVRWRRHPRVSLFLVFGLGLLLIRALIFPLFNWFIYQVAQNVSQLGFFNGILNIAGVIVSVVAWIFILMAVFGGRGQAIQETSFPEGAAVQ